MVGPVKRVRNSIAGIQGAAEAGILLGVGALVVALVALALAIRK
jgi:tetrahydromethanopterin S-methyltransferase subunit B